MSKSDVAAAETKPLSPSHRRSQERDKLWEISPDLLSVIDLQTGTFDSVNPAWTATLGWKTTEMEGRPYTDFVHPEDLAPSSGAYDVAQGGDPVLRFENRYRHVDGSYTWLSWTAIPEGGKLYSSTRDVTAERARAADRDRMWQLSTDVMLVADFGSNVVAVNPAWTAVMGWDQAELIGRSFMSLVHPDDVASTLAEVGKLGAGATTFRFENRYRRKDGTYCVLSWTAVPDERFIHAVGRDITTEKINQAELVRTQGELRQSQDDAMAATLENERRFRLLVQSVTDYAIFMLDPQGRITNWNAGAERIKGYTASEIVGEHFSRFYTPEDLAKGIPALALETSSREGRFEAEGWRVRKDGSLFWANVIIDPIMEDGILLGFAKVTRDLSERRKSELELIERQQHELQLVEAHEKSQALERATQGLLDVERNTSELREQFIAVLGHDLRNPLAAISSGVRLLSKETTEERRKLFLDMMQSSVLRMAVLIDNVLDFARGRLGAGIPLELRLEVSLAPVLEQVVSELRLAEPSRVIETNFDLKTPVKCDPSRIGQLVSNLLGNALTHGSPDQPVRIHADSGNETLVIWIANAGAAIADATMERLFQPFFRGEVRASQQGLGLGLHIASEIAKAHGGTLTVDSSEVETRFTFRMPLAGN